jgi:hypothetical protein
MTPAAPATPAPRLGEDSHMILAGDLGSLDGRGIPTPALSEAGVP